MARRDPRYGKQQETLPQNTGNEVRNDVWDHWRNSVLVGPQTAGIPTVHNEDEWAKDSDEIGSDDFMQPTLPQDRTGGAVQYLRSQRRK